MQFYNTNFIIPTLGTIVFIILLKIKQLEAENEALEM